MTWPLAAHFTTTVLGAPQDNYYYLSWFAWFRHTCLDLHAPSTINPNVFYPFGHNFSTSETTWANVILTLPVLLWGGEVAAYNTAVLASFVLSAFGMYLLVFYLTKSWFAGIVSGAIFAFCPYRMAHLGGGQLPLLGTQWLPLCLWSIERALRERRWSHGLGAGLFYGLAALSSWYYAFMAGLLLPVYVLFRARPWRHYLRERYVWAALFAAVVVAAIMVVPAILPTLRLSGEEGMSYSLQFVDRWSASIADYLLPNPVQTLWGGVTTLFYSGQLYFYERILALGFVPMLLAGLAIWSLRKSFSGQTSVRHEANMKTPSRNATCCVSTSILFAPLRLGVDSSSDQHNPAEGDDATEEPANPVTFSALLWVGAIAFILSLGTTLHWRDVAPLYIPVPPGVDKLFTRLMFNWITRFSLNPSAYHWGYQLPGHIVLPLPAMLFYLYFPFSNAMRVWSRFGLFVILVVSILAGSGLANILRFALKHCLNGWAPAVLSIAFLSALLFEYAAIPFPYGASEVRAQPATEWLRQQPGDLAVIELPLSRALNGPPLYAATLHGKRIAYGYGTFFPREWIAQRSLLLQFPARESLELLRGWGVRYVLVASLNYGETWPEVSRRIAACGDLRAVGLFPEKSLYRGDRWFASTRGTELPFVADTIYVYELSAQAD